MNGKIRSSFGRKFCGRILILFFLFLFASKMYLLYRFKKGFRASINRNKIDSRIYPINRREEMISLDMR